MFRKIREVCESFGYEAYDAPILEPTDLFLAKGNQEIIDEQTYTFPGPGEQERNYTHRNDPYGQPYGRGASTGACIPRMRWYSYQNVWRYERMQRGRLREFWQLNVDIFGVDGIEAEHEIILLADQDYAQLWRKTRHVHHKGK
jgi:histidyl-tRNA synthetase